MNRQGAPRFKLAVFDVAGTTVIDGDAVVDCLHEAIAAWAPVAADEVIGVMGLPKPQAIRQLIATRGRVTDAQLDAAVHDAHEVFRRTLIHYYETYDWVCAAESAEPVFEALRRAGVRVVLDTGFSRDILDALLARLGWREGVTVDLSIASDEVERGRPFPDLILRAMALVNVSDASSVAKIGDTPFDLMQGLAADCGLVVGVTYGTHTREQLQRPGVHVIDRLPELLPLMGIGRV